MSTHLCVRSCYSLLNGVMDVKTMVQTAKSLGFNALACVEYQGMYSVVEFTQMCRKENIKPIYGVELDIRGEETTYRVMILAKNEEGYRHLLALSSLIKGDKPILDLADLQAAQSSCFIIFPSVNGPFDRALRQNDDAGVDDVFAALKTELVHFGVGLSYQESSFFRSKNDRLRKIADREHCFCTALSCVYYQKKDDEVLYRTMRAIDLGVTLGDKTLVSAPDRLFYSPFELEQLYSPADLAMSDQISAQCNVDIYQQKSALPQFVTPNGSSSETYLRQLAGAGLRKRLRSTVIPSEYQTRLDYELQIITSMNFSDYFLIVYDVIRYARQKSIYVGPGRGSSAGSLVAYCIGITHLDPLQYGLLFERFLNPERISMPDIDIDFPDDKRQMVIDYVVMKYGSAHVGHIITFGTLAAKQVLRDVGRVYGVALSKIDRLNKQIPFSVHTRLAEVYQNNSGFRMMIEADVQLKEVYHQALRLEGLPRHVSTHAAGIVLSALPLHEVIATQKVEADTVSSQFPMNTLEELGLIKIDFLGLRNLTIIDEIAHHIRESKPDFDIMKLSLDDAKTYQLVSAADTIGIFQLESEGMKSLLKRMQPNRFMDIADTIALYRPGPMQNIPVYLENRQHPEKIVYLDEVIKTITQDTFGVLVYQEQIMQVAQQFAGFSLGKADVLRKAMSKKSERELMSLKEDFYEGARMKGHEEKTIQAVFDLIYRFANYGFNKSHSVAYALIAYQMAYLKANVPLYFYSSLLNSVIGAESKTAEYLSECRRYQVNILAVSINHSAGLYRIEGYGLRVPLRTVKGVGVGVINALLSEREAHGEYRDYYDFVARANMIKINQRTMEALIYAGALDEFKLGRLAMIANLTEALAYGDLIKVDTKGASRIQLGLVSQPIFKRVEEDPDVVAEREFEVLGFYLTEHPLTKLRRSYPATTLIASVRQPGRYSLLAQIRRVKNHKTKKMEAMAFVVLADESGQCDCVVFPQVYKQIETSLTKSAVVFVEVELRQDSIIIQQLSQLSR